jgi:hypothetical protein
MKSTGRRHLELVTSLVRTAPSIRLIQHSPAAPAGGISVDVMTFEQKVFFVVNARGFIESVGREHPAVTIKDGNAEAVSPWRFATDQEISAHLEQLRVGGS